MITKTNAPLVSIIVFGKRTNKLNENEKKILSSQLYSNVEVVIVEKDASLVSIAASLEQSKGEYFIFWNIENLLSCDYIRALVCAAEEEDADLAMSDICKIKEGRYYYYNLDPIRNLYYSDRYASSFAIYKKYNFMAESVFLPWNKVVCRKLINKIVKSIYSNGNYYDNNKRKENLGEFTAVVINALIMKNAEKYIFVPYVYSYIREKAVKKSDEDLKTALSNFIGCIHVIDKIVDSSETMAKISEYAAKLFYQKYNIQKSSVEHDFKRYFGSKAQDFTRAELYFSSVSTELPSMFFTGERLKKTVASDTCKIVSFDVFDTLIVRPFSKPSDIFSLMAEEFNRIINSESIADFGYMRQYAEKHAREILKEEGKEEVSLADIYEVFGKDFNVSEKICKHMLDFEIDTEMDFCVAKKSGYDLYKFAKYFEREIIIVSDMYLSQQFIEKILKKNNYFDYDRIYVSSEYNKCKHDKKLYELIANDLGLKGENLKTLVHIGDNYSSDFKAAKEFGFNAYHVNNSISMFKGGNSAIFCGEAYKNIYLKSSFFTAGGWSINHYWGLRAFHGMVANHVFDYPFFAFNQKSDFNSDPAFVGYYCVGGLLLGLTRWILKDLAGKKDCTIHFVARDGWLLKAFYDKYTNGLADVPKSNYLYVSRKSLFAADLSGMADILAILNNKLVVANNTPYKILLLIKPLFSNQNYLHIKKYYQAKGILHDIFGSNSAYLTFIKDFVERFGKLFDFESYRKKLRTYFSSVIKPGDVIFDVGYSGRTESILSQLLGFPINSYYVHSNGELLDLRENRYGFQTKVFYPWRPNITGVVREHLLMEYAASVKAYEFNKKGECQLLFNEFTPMVPNLWFTNVIQQAALEFCEDFVRTFGENRDIFAVENFDLLLPCEYFIQLAKPFDRQIFSALDFEDDVGMGGKVSVCDFWGKKYKELTNNLLKLEPGTNSDSASKLEESIKTTSIMKTMLQSLSLPEFPALKLKRERKNKFLLYSNELSWSGAPRSLLRIAKVLIKHGYNVDVWSLYDGDLRAEYDKLNIPVKICDYNNADYAFAVANYDLCIVNAAISYKFYYVISKYLPTIWYIREATNLVDIARGNLGMDEVLQESIDMVCVSEYAKQYITSSYNKNVYVVPNCVEDKYTGVKKSFDAKKIVFTTLGTIEPRKGYDIVVEAVKLLPKSYADRIEYRIAGRVLDYCKNWANQLLEDIKGTKNIVYLGEITREEDLCKVYSQTDIVVVSSRDESCSLVALEGAMFGKPLIVTENTGAKYIVTEENGYVVRTASAQALADAIMRFMDKSADEIYAMGNFSRAKYNEMASMEYYEKCILGMIEDKLACPTVHIEPPRTSKLIVPIIMATNQNYAPYVAVTIQSILENASPNYYYDIYVFYTELGKETIRGLEKETTDKYRVSTVNITNLLNTKLKLRTCSHYTIETYYRFFAPEILSFYDQLIYVDCDLVVLGDISELYKLDIGNNILGAAKNYMNRFVTNYVEKLHVSPEKYFNAGVLIINTKKFIEERIREKAFELLDKREDFIMLDQDALNIVCKDKVYYIPEDWNVQWHHFEGKCDIVINKQACIDAYSAPKILHFTGKNKPWKDARLPKAEFFWKYAEKAGDFQEIIKSLSAANSVTIVNYGAALSKEKGEADYVARKGIIAKLRRFFEVWEKEGLKTSIQKGFKFLYKINKSNKKESL